MPEIELHQLEQPYRGLRIATKSMQRRLLSSLAADGQQAPVLVVEGESSGYVLIDGYQRVKALEQLGRDTVEAVVLELNESSALIFKHRQEASTRRSALEDGWLLRVLIQEHGLSQRELACRLGHTTSWVSRRLGLLTSLPKSVGELVRQGRLSAYSTMRYLVPLARANTADCEKLARNLSDHGISTREMERLYVAWRSSDAEGRARLVAEPLLFLKAAEELERSEPPHPDAALVKDIDVLGALCRRVARRMSRRERALAAPSELVQSWAVTLQSINALMGKMKERIDD